MGKIRSTLDIVMERTKNMSMTEDDRRKLRYKELSDSVRAWVQRYLDSKMALGELTSQLASAEDERPEVLDLLKGELIGNIRLDMDNTKILDALEAIGAVDKDRAARVIGYRQEDLRRKAAGVLDLLKVELQRQGIRGSAVMPNLSKSGAWQETLRKEQEELARSLSALS